jgi:hypothetical protein
MPEGSDGKEVAMRRSGGWTLVFLAGLAITASGLPAASAVDGLAEGPGASAKVRTDGVYYLSVDSDKDANGVPLCSAVRLYEDGTALDVEFHGRPSDVAKWLDRDKDDLFPGTWALDGDKLTVVVSTGLAETSQTGTLGPQGWRITDTVTFAFAPLPFPQGRPGANRRPYFIGHGESAIGFDYDRAGNLRGINHELEIRAVDPDGDALQYTWTSSNGTLEPHGPKVIWKRPVESGRPLSGEIGVEVADGKGGRVSFKKVMK